MPQQPDILLDFDRINRCGVEEAVLCEFKTAAQIQTILEVAKNKQKRMLLTRLSPQKHNRFAVAWKNVLTYDEVAQCAVYGKCILDDAQPATIAIVSAGSSDAFVCTEALITLNYHGIACDIFQDVGVAGLWRLQQCLPKLKEYDVVIAVAGMEAALPTVLSGLICAPIIAVPTSVGYGVSAGGQVALNACLASCAGGLMTMNIDNGYGAAIAAIKIYNKIKQHQSNNTSLE